jgi:hypothetical protein
MAPIFNDKRELLIAAKECGEKEKTIAEWLQISSTQIKTTFVQRTCICNRKSLRFGYL